MRDQVSFGLGMLGVPIDAWLGAYAAEPEPTVAANMLVDLGRALDVSRAGPLLRTLDGPAVHLGCQAMIPVVERTPAPPEPTVALLIPPVLRGAAQDPASGAAACLELLMTLESRAIQPHLPAIERACAAGLNDADAERRARWLALAGRFGLLSVSDIERTTSDPDWRVAVAAYEVLAQRGGAARSAFESSLSARLERALAGQGSATDPLVIEAALASAHRLGDSSEVVAWLRGLVDRAATAGPGAVRLQCAAEAAHDAVRGWPNRVLACGAGLIPAWVGAVRAAEILGAEVGSDSVREVQLRRLFASGDWHAQQAVVTASTSLPAAQGLVWVADGLSIEHPAVQRAALDAAAVWAPKLRAGGQPLPDSIAQALHSVIPTFHVKHDVDGMLAWLRVVRLGRLRAELGQVIGLARSGIGPIRQDARALLAEWGHALPSDAIEPVPNVVARESLDQIPAELTLPTPSGPLTLALDTQHAPVAAARVADWLGARPLLEVRRVEPGRYLTLANADGLPQPPWRSEESRAPLRRGTVLLTPGPRDGVSGSITVLLRSEPRWLGRVTVVGEITRGLDRLETLPVGQLLGTLAPPVAP